MKRQLLIVVCVATSAAFALPPVRPVLPSVEHVDTEATTNVLKPNTQLNLLHQ